MRFPPAAWSKECPPGSEKRGEPCSSRKRRMKSSHEPAGRRHATRAGGLHAGDEGAHAELHVDARLDSEAAGAWPGISRVCRARDARAREQPRLMQREEAHGEVEEEHGASGGAGLHQPLHARGERARGHEHVRLGAEGDGVLHSRRGRGRRGRREERGRHLKQWQA